MIDVAKVNIFGPFDSAFCYLVGEAEVGDLVLVEFGKRKLHGVCIEVLKISAEDLLLQEKIKPEKLKPIESTLFKKVFSIDFISFLQKAAEYNMIPFGNILEIAIPSITFKKPKKKYEPNVDDLVQNFEISLNSEQKLALDTILQNLYQFKTFLINGVTGSGKTQVYVAAMKEILLDTQAKNQILILMPEISLTPAVAEGIKKRFGIKIGKWHSSMTPAQKRDTILGIIDGSLRVIVGARSAVFLPYKNLKMIIVDEEHDHSYKQDETPVYHGRDMAILRSSIEKIPILLASATPSVESYYNALLQKYQMISLNQRFGDAKMPDIEILDLGAVKRVRGKMLSIPAQEALINNLQSGNQVMIFLNRRGYAKIVKCNNCDFVFNCPNCTNKLTFHKKNNNLKCHYCDFSIFKPQDCPACQNKDCLIDSVPGVEQLKEEVEELCPNYAKVSIFSSDEVSGKDQIIQKIAEIESMEYNVIIGTQIVSKGHNFPNLALVIVVGFDVSNNQNDPRIFEKLYQLLVQVAGRAGRAANINGKVLIQALNTKHPVLKAIIENDQEKFYKEEILRRKEGLLPPFLRQVNLIISSEIEDTAKQHARLIAQNMRKLLQTEKYQGKIGILGPSETLIPYLKRKYRFSILLESTKVKLMKELIKECLLQVKASSKVHIKIDIDPYNFS